MACLNKSHTKQILIFSVFISGVISISLHNPHEVEPFVRKWEHSEAPRYLIPLSISMSDSVIEDTPTTPAEFNSSSVSLSSSKDNTADDLITDISSPFSHTNLNGTTSDIIEAEFSGTIEVTGDIESLKDLKNSNKIRLPEAGQIPSSLSSVDLPIHATHTVVEELHVDKDSSSELAPTFAIATLPIDGMEMTTTTERQMEEEHLSFYDFLQNLRKGDDKVKSKGSEKYFIGNFDSVTEATPILELSSAATADFEKVHEFEKKFTATTSSTWTPEVSPSPLKNVPDSTDVSSTEDHANGENNNWNMEVLSISSEELQDSSTTASIPSTSSIPITSTKLADSISLMTTSAPIELIKQMLPHLPLLTPPSKLVVLKPWLITPTPQQSNQLLKLPATIYPKSTISKSKPQVPTYQYKHKPLQDSVQKSRPDKYFSKTDDLLDYKDNIGDYKDDYLEFGQSKKSSINQGSYSYKPDTTESLTKLKTSHHKRKHKKHSKSKSKNKNKKFNIKDSINKDSARIRYHHFEDY